MPYYEREFETVSYNFAFISALFVVGQRRRVGRDVVGDRRAPARSEIPLERAEPERLESEFRPLNAEAVHLVLEGGALEAEALGGPVLPGDPSGR